MSLAALNWKQLPNQIVASGSTSPADIINAIGDAFASTTYIDGTARTPGSGTAWTRTISQVGGITEAVYLAPVSSTLGQRVCIGGSGTTARALTILSGTTQTSVINLIYAGVGKNVTTNAANWYSNPFADGSFSGYAVFGAARSSTLSATIRCYECSDAVAVTVEQGGAVYGAAILGAWLDPESANASDAESDGKLYGLATLGTAASGVSTGSPSGGVNWAANNTNAASALLFATASGGNTTAQAAVFTPGAGTTLQVSMSSAYGNFATYAGMTTMNFINVRFPIMMAQVPYSAAIFIGRVREIWYSGYALNGTAYENNGSLVGFLISANSGQSGQALLLTT